MNFASIIDGVNEIAQATALEILSKDISIDSLESLNEPIDKFGISAKDAPKGGLDETSRKEIKSETGWPNSIVESIRTSDEAQIYMDANLEVSNVDGKDCLVRSDIDYRQVIDGQTNLERMSEGKCPVAFDGQKIELHHIGQNPDAPLAELTTEEHRGEGNDLILHDKTIAESKIDRITFRQERESYWRTRAEQIINEK